MNSFKDASVNKLRIVFVAIHENLYTCYFKNVSELLYTAKRILERLGIQTLSSFVKIL